MQREHLEQQFRTGIDWLTSGRWFGDKARPVTDLRVLVVDSVDVAGQRLLLPLVQFEHEWGEPSLYFVPVMEGDGPLSEREATANLDVLRWFVDGFRENREVAGEGIWRWREIGSSLPDLSGLGDSDIRLISGEQSNSSVIFGQGAIAKLFRRVQPGVNPDLEIGAHLMRVEQYDHSPDLYGIIQLELDGERIDIAALQQFVPNSGDGWVWMLEQLSQPDRRHGLVDDAHLLGKRSGELHLALSQEFDDPNFEAESIEEPQAQAIIRRIIGEMEGSVEGLTHHLQPDEVEHLHKRLGLMMADAWSMVDTVMIRVHGDYHLGQTLRTLDGDFVIIDFEGEPSRTMTERRQKFPALKDVAGMIRSFDYAGASVMQEIEDEQERADIAACVKDMSQAFVDAYREAIASSTLPLVPSKDDAFTSVLNLMIAEKALYELRYEMNNRPDWLWIPLTALLRLVDTEEIE